MLCQSSACLRLPFLLLDGVWPCGPKVSCRLDQKILGVIELVNRICDRHESVADYGQLQVRGIAFQDQAFREKFRFCRTTLGIGMVEA